MATPRSGSTTTCGLVRPPGTPSSTSPMMASGSSCRGLSDVRNARSLSRAAAAPMRGRLARSRFPPQPKTQSTRPAGVNHPRLTQHDLQPSRRVRVVDEHRKGGGSRHPCGLPGAAMTCNRPWTGPRWAMARAIPSGPRPDSLRASAASAARSALSTLTAPVSGVTMRCPRQVNSEWPGTQHNVGGHRCCCTATVGIRARSSRALPPGIVGIHHAAQRVARGEEPRLRLEVLLHRPVVVEVVVAEVGEDPPRRNGCPPPALGPVHGSTPPWATA